MPIDRYYCHVSFVKQKQVILSAQEFHHLVHVTRATSGDTVALVNGKGMLASARVEKVEKHQATLRILSTTREEPPSFSIMLALAIPRFHRLDGIIEKGTELGMTEVLLFPGRYSERTTISPRHLERMKTIAISAMKQCGRLFLPSLTLRPPLDNWESVGEFPAYFGDLADRAPTLLQTWRQNPPQKGALLLIGPEKGWSREEEERLRTLGALGVKLHENILRTDTASLMGLALISHLHYCDRVLS